MSTAFTDTFALICPSTYPGLSNVLQTLPPDLEMLTLGKTSFVNLRNVSNENVITENGIPVSTLGYT